MRNIVIASLIFVGVASAACVYFSKGRALVAQVGPQIVLYSGENFTGESLAIRGTLFDLPVRKNAAGEEEFNWNDEVRSLVVNGGTWRLYQNGRCNTVLDGTKAESLTLRQKEAAGGWSALVSATSRGPLQIPNAAAGGIWRDVSSVELVSEQNLPDWAMDFRK